MGGDGGGMEFEGGEGLEFALRLGLGIGTMVEVSSVGGWVTGMEGSSMVIPEEGMGKVSGCEEVGREATLRFDVGLDVEGVSGEGGAFESFASSSASASAFTSFISTSSSASFCVFTSGEAEREDEEAMDEGRRVGFPPRRGAIFILRRGTGEGGSELGL